MWRMKWATALVAVGFMFLKGACVMAADSNEVAVIETKLGKMVIEFYDKDAPKTVANFKKLAKEAFYNGTAFHRIIQGFMIQGGDPLSKDPSNTNVGGGGPGYQIAAEFNTNKHVLGVVSMARKGDPNSAGSQFFICLGEAAHLDGKYTAFGKVIAGIDVVKKIGAVPTSGPEKSVPEERVVVEKVTITPQDEALKK